MRTRLAFNRHISQAVILYSTALRLSSKFQDDRRRNRDSTSRTYRSAPLVPQSTLFLLRKSEELSMDAHGAERDYSFIGNRESAGKDIEK